MKKIIVLIIIAALMTGCGLQPPKKLSVKEADSIENNYIKSVHLSVTQINTSINKLSKLLSRLNVDDTTWKNNVSAKLTELELEADIYSNGETQLAEAKEKMNKYKKTRTIMDQGTSKLLSIIKKANNALDNSDKDTLKIIKNQLNPVNYSLQKGLKQVEIDHQSN